MLLIRTILTDFQILSRYMAIDLTRKTVSTPPFQNPDYVPANDVSTNKPWLTAITKQKFEVWQFCFVGKQSKVICNIVFTLFA